MPDYGVTPEGFVAKPLETILEDLIEDIHAVPGMEELDTSPESVAGKQIGSFGNVVREVWELGEANYAAHDPDQAVGAQQDAVNAIRGARRLGAKKGTVSLRLTLAPGATVQSGKGIAQVSGQPGNRWVLTETVTNSGGIQADIDADAESEFTGPTQALAGTITVIAAPAVGWTAVTNPLDAVPGRNVETNAEFRIRAEQETQSAGTTPLEACITDVKRVKGVTRVFGFENVYDTTDVDGIPPHSIELVVQGGADADVAKQIWKSKGGGVRTHSSNTPPTYYDIVDSNGQNRRIYWTRPTVVPAYLTYTLDKNDEYVSDAVFKAAIATWSDEHVGAGDSLKFADMLCQGKDQLGVDDASVTLGFSASPTGQSNLNALPRQIIDVDTSRIVVNS